MTSIKYFCPHCMRFKHWWHLKIYAENIVRCRHCGHEIVGVTKEYIEEAVMDKIRVESDDKDE